MARVIVVPNIAFRGDLVAAGEELPPVRIARQLVELGAREVALLDLDGVVAGDVLPEWLPSLVAVAGVPVRFDGRVHDGSRIERLTRAGLATVVVDQDAVFDPIILRWALDLHGPGLCVELQVDGEYVFDAPPEAYGRELVDVLEALHMSGARRVLYRDVTGEALPLQRLLELGDRTPGLRFTYQGSAVRTVGDVTELAMVGPVLEAVLVDSQLVLDGGFDLAAANRAAAPHAGR
jgi:phosphoribosylformimino-5-aminoimidazole carboxamide ribonucleotide (ProFAR) isomerase